MFKHSQINIDGDIDRTFETEATKGKENTEIFLSNPRWKQCPLKSISETDVTVVSKPRLNLIRKTTSELHLAFRFKWAYRDFVSFMLASGS